MCWFVCSNLTWSGGSVNHYVSRLVGVVLKMGLETEHLHNIRHIYKVGVTEHLHNIRHIYKVSVTEHLHNIRHIYKVGVFFVAWMFLSAKPDSLVLNY